MTAQLLTLLISLAGSSCCFAPDPGQRPDSRTSTQRLQFAPQRPSDDEKEKNRIRIGITVEQQKQIDDLYTQTRAKMDEVRKAMGDAQRRQWELYDKYDVDENAAKQIRIELLRLHRKMGEIHAENERALRRIMSREQFDRLRAIMREQWQKRMQEMQQRRGGKPGPPPGGPPQGL